MYEDQRFQDRGEDVGQASSNGPAQPRSSRAPPPVDPGWPALFCMTPGRLWASHGPRGVEALLRLLTKGL